jgi:hypothetical protein
MKSQITEREVLLILCLLLTFGYQPLTNPTSQTPPNSACDTQRA